MRSCGTLRRWSIASLLCLLTGIALQGAPPTAAKAPAAGLPALLREAVSAKGQARDPYLAKIRGAVGPDVNLAGVLRLASPLPRASRRLLAKTLSERGATALMPQVIAAVGRKECSVQFAKECCGSLGASAVPFLVGEVASELVPVRFLAAHGLGLYQDQCPESVAPLCKLAEDKDQATALSALFSLRVFGPRPDMCGPVVRRLLVDKRPVVRLAAIAAVPRLVGPDPASIDRLLTIAADATVALAERKAAVGIFDWFDSKETLGRLDRLIGLLDDPEPAIRETMLMVLAGCRRLPDEVGEKLLRMLRATPSQPGISPALAHCSSVYAEATPLVVKQLRTPDVALRREAAVYFDLVFFSGSYKLDPATREALLPSVSDADIHVRLNTISALRQYTTDPAVRKALQNQLRKEPNRRMQTVIDAALARKPDPE